MFDHFCRGHLSWAFVMGNSFWNLFIFEDFFKFDPRSTTFILCIRIVCMLAIKNLFIIKTNGLYLFYISNYSTWMFAHAFHTCGLCWQSHLNDKTYSPASSDSGTSTKSLKAHSTVLYVFGRLILVHSDPCGVVPVVVLTESWGIHPSSL